MHRLLLCVLILAASVLAEEPFISTRIEQQTTADRLYSQVIDRCCLQKPAALRIKAEIVAMVQQGKSEKEILANYQGLIGPLDQTAPDSWSWAVPSALFIVVIATAAALGIWSRRLHRT